jgi:hypothetical protein
MLVANAHTLFLPGGLLQALAPFTPAPLREIPLTQRLPLLPPPQAMRPAAPPTPLLNVDLFRQQVRANAAVPAQPISLPAMASRPQPRPAGPPHTANDPFARIRAGSVLNKGDRSSLVQNLQERLTKLGYNVPATGYFGDMTQTVVKRFQRDQRVQQTGQFGPTTLAALEKAEQDRSAPAVTAATRPEPRPTVAAPVPAKPAATSTGRKLADTALREARSRGTTGWCYSAVAESIARATRGRVNLSGRSAYMAAPQLARSPLFDEVSIRSRNDLAKLPAGSVVVWGKGRSKHGHISVALGNGKEASDHITGQMTAHYGGGKPRVFVPIA